MSQRTRSPTGDDEAAFRLGSRWEGELSECADCGGTRERVAEGLAEELWRCQECRDELWIPAD